ncbi:MAG: hypothetical protein WDN69_23675 [Aliidongia sp.]
MWHGTKTLFPDAYEELAEAVPAAERADLLAAYARRTADPRRRSMSRPSRR